MKRRALTFLSRFCILACVLVCAAAVALWVRTDEVRDVVRFGWDRRGPEARLSGLTLSSGWECLTVCFDVRRPIDPRVMDDMPEQPRFWYRAMRPGRSYPWLNRGSSEARVDGYGFTLYWPHREPTLFVPAVYGGPPGLGPVVVMVPATMPATAPGGGWWVRRWAVAVPHWFLVLLTAPWPLLWAVKRRWAAQGNCPECGWELWDPDQPCPGCGRRADGKAPAGKPAPHSPPQPKPHAAPLVPRPYPGYPTLARGDLRAISRRSAWRRAF